MVNGLPHSGKSKVVKNFIREISPGEIIPKPDHGLSFHELLAVQEHDKTIKYQITTSEDCYFYAMQSAMRQTGYDMKLQSNGEDNSERKKMFNNDGLDAHFWKTFAQLRDGQEQASWVNKHISGVALFNIWDIGYSRTVHHFLSPLHHLLHKSYSWLFFDLERDSKDPFKPPDVYDGENLLRWHSRIHYLIRAAKFSEPRLPQKIFCSTMFATHDGKLTENEWKEKISSIKPNLKYAATQTDVAELNFVDFDNIVSIDLSCSTKQFTANMNDLVTKVLQARMKVPVSFIFLRSFYYTHNKMLYAKKTEIKQLADELRISSKNFQEFCEVFTSFGSIIDVSLIDSESEYIIMKPDLFLDEINKIFHTNDSELADTGILTLSAAEDFFGSTANAEAYMDILVSLSLAVRLTHVQVESLPSLDSSTVLYLPDIRTTTPIEDSTELRSNVLRLIRGQNAPPDHLQVSFVTEFLKLNENSSVCIQENVPNNVTVIKAFDPARSNPPIEFKVVYFGHTLEFRFTTANKEIFTQIIICCHKVMSYDYHKKTKYDFAIMCSKDPIPKREYHYLPDSELCKRCQTNERLQDPISNMWNAVVEVNRLMACICMKFIIM